MTKCQIFVPKGISINGIIFDTQISCLEILGTIIWMELLTKAISVIYGVAPEVHYVVRVCYAVGLNAFCSPICPMTRRTRCRCRRKSKRTCSRWTPRIRRPTFSKWYVAWNRYIMKKIGKGASSAVVQKASVISISATKRMSIFLKPAEGGQGGGGTSASV